MSPRTTIQNTEIRAKKRALIMGSALSCFAEAGYHQTSISKIAKTANISKGLIYNYFESKETLLNAIVNEGLDKILQLFPLKKEENITAAAIEIYIRKTFTLLQKELPHWKLYFSLLSKPKIMQLFQARIIESTLPIMEKLTVYYKNKGEKNPYAKTRLFTATLDGVCMNLIFETTTFPIKDTIEIIIENFT